VIRHDAVDVVEHMIALDSLAGVHVYFPDPWPKKRHHKRRLVQPAFATLAARKLAPGGTLHAATDWPDYATHMSEVFSGEALLQAAETGFTLRPATKFETRGKRLGHPIRDLYFRRLAR
jgi:tRNA (guanine-N7-)-methyltransferase